MLTDRGSAGELDDPERSWLDGVRLLHVPLYSLLAEPLAATCRTLIGWAAERGIDISIDASSTSAIEALGSGVAAALIADIAPTFLLANQAEAALLSTTPPPAPPRSIADARPSGRGAAGGGGPAPGDGSSGDGVGGVRWAGPGSGPVIGLGGLAGVAVIEKRGPGPAVVHPGAGAPEAPVAVVPANDLGPVGDTTGAGDAFAAGFLMSWLAGADVVESARSGHAVAADHLRALASARSR